MLRHVLIRLGLAPLFLLLVAFNAGADVLFYDFSSQPAGTRFLDPTGPAARPNPRIEGGILKLTDAGDPGNFAGFAIGPFDPTTIAAMSATWRSRIGGGGGGGADGYSFNIGTDLADNFTGEEGTGTGLTVTVDTFDNGATLDPGGTGIQIKYGGNIVAFAPVPKDNPGDGRYLRKDTFVDAAVTVAPSGAVSFVYDGIGISYTIPSFAGLAANQYIFGARTGGANDNQWIDDLRIVTQTPDIQLLTITGSPWRFTNCVAVGDPATVVPLLSDPGYNDSTWAQGVGLFGVEPTASEYFYDSDPSQVIPQNTPIPNPGAGGPIVEYFRTTFNWTAGDPTAVTLRTTNYIDDACVWYLNGVEVARVRIAAGQDCTTFGSNPPSEGTPDLLDYPTGVLRSGVNVLVAELHQSSAGSSDDIFGMSLSARVPIPPTIVDPLQPTNTTVFANRSTTFRVAAIGSPAVSYQWYKDGSPIDAAANPTATSSSLVLSNVQADAAGNYFARVANSLGSVDSRTAVLTVLPAVPLKIVRAAGSLDLRHVTVVYDQFVDATTAGDLFNYAVDGFGVTAITLNPDGVSVLLTLDPAGPPQEPNQNYCVTVSGVLSGAQLPLDPNPTTVCYQSFVVSCGFAVKELYLGLSSSSVAIADLRSSPKYPGSPDIVRYGGLLELNTFDEFEGYGARLSGYLIPPTSGNYTFYMASDDNGELWLSTDSSPANIVNIANEPVWSNRRTWTGEAGGGGRIGVPSPSGGPQANISGPIALVAGQRYYFEALMKEGGGGDNLAVAWQRPGDPVPLNGSSPIPGVYLASLADPSSASLTINQQPLNQRVVLNPGARALLSQDFNAGDGGFTVETPQPFAPPGTPWTYSAATGSWQVNQEGAEVGHPQTSRLRSTPLTVTRSGVLQLSFSHRWSMESPDWDGGQVRVSVNGGAFTAVPLSAFTAGPYNGRVRPGSASVLANQDAFIADSPGHQTPTFINSVANLGVVAVGDVVQLEFLYSGDTNTRGTYQPSWELDSLTLTEGISVQQTVSFTVAASAVVGGSPSQNIFYQWERDCGAGFALIPGANSAALTFSTRLADNGCRFRVRMYVPGATTVSDAATLQVVQPNTPPQFTCGPAPQPVECGGAGQVSVPNWATDIRVHSIDRVGRTFSFDFSSQPAGTRLLDPSASDGVRPRIEDGVLKLSNAENLGVGGFGGFAIGPFPVQNFDTIDVSWKSRVGGGGNGGADGYSLNIGTDLADNFQGEEGTGTGVSVTVDTFDNGTGLDVGVDFKWKGNRVAYIPLPKDDDGTGHFLRKDTFVDASLSITAGGAVTLNYDGSVATVQLAGYTGVPATQVIFGAREGGANDRHWIDDLNFAAYPADASSAEAGQTVHFNVSNDNPALFSAQPAVSPNGTLTYALAPGATGSAHVTVVAQDNGGTADGGRDTSSPCTFTVSVGDTRPPTVTCPGDITTTGTSPAGCVVTYTASGSDSCGLASLVCMPASGSTFPVGMTTVTCTATDGAGNTASCTFKVTCEPPPIGGPTAVINSEQLIDLRPEFDNPVLLSCNWWNACLVADGYSSTGSGPLTYLWFADQDPVPFAAGPVVTNCLEVGEHTIILVVTDSTGRTGTTNKTIEVVTAPLAIDLLIEQIETANKSGIVLTRKITRELTATLRVALGHAGREELRATQQALDAFEKKVRAQVVPIAPDAAAAWIRWSQAVSAGMEKCIKPPRKPKHDDPKDPDPKDPPRK